MKHRKEYGMKKEETQGAQWFILRLIGNHLEQIALHELKNSVDLLNYYKSWNKELEELYKKNSFYIKNGEFDKVEIPQRHEPPKF